MRADLPTRGQKKAGVMECSEAFHHAGLLVNESPDIVGLLFNQSSDTLHSQVSGDRSDLPATFAAWPNYIGTRCEHKWISAMRRLQCLVKSREV